MERDLTDTAIVMPEWEVITREYSTDFLEANAGGTGIYAVPLSMVLVLPLTKIISVQLTKAVEHVERWWIEDTPVPEGARVVCVKLNPPPDPTKPYTFGISVTLAPELVPT